jgi:hypothetical protein
MGASIDPIQAIETQVGIPAGYLWNLRNEDDWSFVIKGHAFIEAAMTHLLAESLNKTSLVKIFARLDMSDPNRGKLAFLKDLELLGSKELSFIMKVSELRNDLVHDIRNTTFVFEKYLRGLDKNQKKSFLSAISFSLKPNIEIANKTVVPKICRGEFKN